MTEKPIRLLAGNGIFRVPERVALEAGLFADHGVDVEVSADWDERTHVIKDARKDPLALFENGVTDTFNMCEWGVLHRIERAERPARVVYIRPAIVAQAVVSFQDDVQEPHDLADVPVAINESTGQHFTTLKLLEGPLTRDEIRLEHAGPPAALLQSLHDKRYVAATLMEPFISLALKQGAHVLGSLFYRGAQAFSADVSVEQQRRFILAINDAVDLVNADPDRYREYITVASGGQLAPEELKPDYYRFVHAQPYTEERFAEQYAWLRTWGLVEGGHDAPEFVDNRALAAG